MFGRMMIEPVVQLGPGVDLQTAIATLIKVAENVEIVRWIELPTSVLLFLLVPGDPDSGAVYVLDRKKGTWYVWVPKTPSDLKIQGFRSFVRSWWLPR